VSGKLLTAGTVREGPVAVKHEPTPLPLSNPT
jgi:hypothetical protein